jgi:type IV pilus assembly protein PilW
MKRQMSKWVNKRGFSLMELLVAMVIAGVVMSAIYYTYYSQQKSYVAQKQVAAMQQNLRVAMLYMEREIRMAGCDPTRNANAGITTADAGSISFTMDIEGDSAGSDPDGDTDDPDEVITYSLAGTDLLRNGNLIAEEIDALDFVYLDRDGGVTASISQVRSVQITIVARTGKENPGYINTNAYYNQQDLVNPILPAQNDGFRRRLLTTNIKCRNLGL